MTNTCNKEQCNISKDLFIETTPNLEIAKRRFERFKEAVEIAGFCEGVCYPLIEIMARIEDERN